MREELHVYALLAVLILTILVLAAVMWGKRRMRGLAEAGERLGFAFQPDAQALLGEGIRAAGFLRRGFQTQFTNVMRGQTASGSVAIFEFRYRTDDPWAYRVRVRTQF